METLTNAYNSAAAAACSALYGDNAGTQKTSESTLTEPISGAGGVKTDDPSKPYDGGNDPSLNKSAEPSLDKKSDEPALDKPATHGNVDEPALNKPAVHEKPTDPSATTFDPSKGTDSSAPSESTEATGAPSSATGAQAKHQGAGRPAEEPNKEERAAVNDERKETEQEQKKDYGDGPDATGSGESAATGASSGGPPAGGAPPIGGGAGPDDGPKVETESHGEGTGTKYVKSSGMASEGGDFDATKPGAGREADRLLEQKGINRSAGGNIGEPQKADDDDTTGTTKPSLKDRIKEKLHR